MHNVTPSTVSDSHKGVTLQAGGIIKKLGTEPTIVPAGPMVLVLPPGARSVKLDGKVREPLGHSPALLPVDLSRSVGFHRIEVDGRSHWFATDDSKLALDGIEQMLRYLREHHLGTTWSGQIMFSDGQVLRDPHVVFGWLEGKVSPVVDTVRAIAQRPIWGMTRQDNLSRRGGPGVVPSATHALLRSSPAQYLELDDHGILTVGEQRYNPLRVVARQRTTSLGTIAHLRMIALLEQIGRLVSEVRDYVDDRNIQQVCKGWHDQIRAVLASRFCRELRRANVTTGALSLPASHEEVSDRRYRLMYEVALSLRKGFGWDATRRPQDRYSYVTYADQVYQAFVGVVIAEALECRPTDPALGRAPQVAFANDVFKIILNRVPPNWLLRSWRHGSVAPDALRPDVLIEHLPDRRVLLIDAKYRAAGHRTSESSRSDVMVYMAAFGLNTAVIAYPASDSSTRPVIIEGSGQRLIELPIVPHTGLGDALRQWLPELLRCLRWGSY